MFWNGKWQRRPYYWGQSAFRWDRCPFGPAPVDAAGLWAPQTPQSVLRMPMLTKSRTSAHTEIHHQKHCLHLVPGTWPRQTEELPETSTPRWNRRTSFVHAGEMMLLPQGTRGLAAGWYISQTAEPCQRCIYLKFFKHLLSKSARNVNEPMKHWQCVVVHAPAPSINNQK